MPSISTSMARGAIVCIAAVGLSRLTLFPAAAQQGSSSTRIAQAADETNITILKGNTHPLARPEFDRGPAPTDLLLNRMLLVLRRSPQQGVALMTLLDQLQRRSSSNYHAWLTPEQFGQQFGPAEQDIQAITSWLGSHGFHVDNVANGRMLIEFSGTAGQVKEAFHTEIHKYEINGQEHWANSGDPQIPRALASTVAGIVSLHNFPRRPQHHIIGTVSRERASGRYQLRPSESGPAPFWTTAGGACGLAGGGCYAMGPYDLATIYNSLPLWNATKPIDGTGQGIAIVSQSDIYTQDFTDFRSDFGLPPGTLIVTHNGADAGKLASGEDETETDLDMEWAGSVAKGATIHLVISATTNTTAGVDLSAQYIVDNNVAPILSESYGACELEMGTAGNQFYNQLWQQAAAEGITVFVSTGDSGSAVCDDGSAIATQGLAVNGISSTPYNVAVGGTDFDDLQNPPAYWSPTNNPTTLESALGYIPEMTWNDTCTNSEFFSYTGQTTAESDCNDSSSVFWPNFLAPIAGSGGASNCITSTDQSLSSCSGGYAKPSWQSGVGVPADGARDVPDVSLFAANGLNASFYVVCETDIYGGCAGNPETMVAIGGTSASAPAFAGIMAMINQATGSRQGNANYVFYSLAAQPQASCNSSGTPGSSCIFYDVTKGTIAMPCTTGSPNCVTDTSGDQFGVLSGYAATAGYDPATGLGSVNIANLVKNWDTVTFQPTVSTLAISPTTQITHGTPVNVNITVAPQTGTGTPAGQVSLLTGTGQKDAGMFTLTSGSVSQTTSALPGGSYTVTAYYAGDGTYAASASSPGIPVTISAEASTTTLEAFTLDQNGSAIPFTTGSYGGPGVFLRANVVGQSGEGVPTGTINLAQTLNGTTTTLPGGPFPLNSEGYTMTPGLGLGIFYAPGSYSFTATYSGDASFKAGNSPPVSFTITQAQTSTSTNIVPCPASGQCDLPTGVQVTIFASVDSSTSSFSSLPTGTMTFYSNGTPLGSPVAIDSNIVPPVASVAINQTSAGQYSIAAQYSGDMNYVGSTSPATVIYVGQTFAMTANPTVINVGSPGQSGSTVLTFAAQNGFTGSTTLSPSMCSNLPSKASCSFSPATVTFTSSTTMVPVTLTINTTAPSSATTFPTFSIPPVRASRSAFKIVAVCLIGVCIVSLSTRGKRRWGGYGGFFAFAIIASAIGCGGGGGGGGGGSSPGTPAGNYTGVTVTVAINGVTQTVNNLSINIQ
jgi:hypothetical protein